MKALLIVVKRPENVLPLRQKLEARGYAVTFVDNIPEARKHLEHAWDLVSHGGCEWRYQDIMETSLFHIALSHPRRRRAA